MALFSRKLVAATLSAAGALVVGSMLASTPAAAKPYTCWNPAICKAVCGSATCGSYKVNSQVEAQLQRQARFKNTAIQHSPRASATR